MSIDLGSFFHLYGLILGVGVLTALEISERVARKHVTTSCWNWIVVVGLLCGVVGARAWHVGTDFELYQDNLWRIPAIWDGGASIIGALFGGALGVWLTTRFVCRHCSVVRVFDVLVLGVPFGQAIGRLGNYVNQELYGVPSSLPWAVAISPEKRAPGYLEYSTFHPLFAYEMILLIIFGVWQWRRRESLVGSGILTARYVVWYSFVRFSLDFLRIDAAASWIPGLSLNQVVVAGTALAGVLWLRCVTQQEAVQKQAVEKSES